MPDWNFDLSKAPRGRYVVKPLGSHAKGHRKQFEPARIIVASACGIVTVSNYLPDERRWNMFSHRKQPIAWMPYAGPREVTDANGKTRKVHDLPAHPTMAESWYQRRLRGEAA